MKFINQIPVFFLPPEQCLNNYAARLCPAYVLFLWQDSIPLMSSISFVGEQTAAYAAW